jgi:hypothetical protein
VYVSWVVVDDCGEEKVMEKNDVEDLIVDAVWYRFVIQCVVGATVIGVVAIGLFLIWITGNWPW